MQCLGYSCACRRGLGGTTSRPHCAGDIGRGGRGRGFGRPGRAGRWSTTLPAVCSMYSRPLATWRSRWPISSQVLLLVREDAWLCAEEGFVSTAAASAREGRRAMRREHPVCRSCRSHDDDDDWALIAALGAADPSTDSNGRLRTSAAARRSVVWSWLSSAGSLCRAPTTRAICNVARRGRSFWRPQPVRPPRGASPDRSGRRSGRAYAPQAAPKVVRHMAKKLRQPSNQLAGDSQHIARGRARRTFVFAVAF